MSDSIKKARSDSGAARPGNPAALETGVTQQEQTRFPIVAIGASAGGLDAFTAVLANTSPTTGMAFVIIQHLAPQQPSRLVQLLARATSMPLTEASDGMPLSPNHVYVIPPNARMAVAGGVLSIEPRVHGPGPPLSIDHFFRSLALDRNALAIGVVLSGNESDGTVGLAEIRSEGGVAIVQTPASAKNSDMPRAAIADGVVDLVLTPENIGRELNQIARRLNSSSAGDA